MAFQALDLGEKELSTVTLAWLVQRIILACVQYA